MWCGYIRYAEKWKIYFQSEDEELDIQMYYSNWKNTFLTLPQPRLPSSHTIYSSHQIHFVFQTFWMETNEKLTHILSFSFAIKNERDAASISIHHHLLFSNWRKNISKKYKFCNNSPRLLISDRKSIYFDILIFGILEIFVILTSNWITKTYIHHF